jgi:peptidylprolyl isomerase
VRSLQETLETIKYDIGSKRKSAAIDGAKKSKAMLGGKQADKMAAACQSPQTCTEYMKEMSDGLDPLIEAMKASEDAFTGSDQEREALDKAYNAQEKVVDLLTKLEEQMIPPGYETPVPPEYSDLPQLKRRAKVEMVVKKGQPGAQFDVNGVNFPQAKLVMIIDGYTGEHKERY